MRTRGSWGWLLLAAALAAPLFIFYQRWSKVNKEKATEVSSKARRRLPEGVFAAGAGGSKMTNPIAAEEAGAAVPVSTAPAEAAAAAAPASQPAAVAAAQEPSPAAEPAPQAALPAAEAEVSSVAAVAIAPAADAAAPPDAALARDPLLSPYDRYMIEQAELQRLLRQQELQASAPKAAPRRAPISFERTISLQGIVSNSEGANMAIVNGEMVTEGGMVGPAKVVRITPQSVVFFHKNKKFIKYLSK